MKKKNPSLTTNFLMSIILKMSSMIFPLITFPYISRVLLADGNGKIQFATSLISYFTLLSQLGIPTYGIRACAVSRDDRMDLTRTVHELFIIQLVMTFASYSVFFVLLPTVPKLAEEKTLYLITSAGIFLNAVGMEWLFQGLEQYTYITVRSILFKFLSIAAMFALVHVQEDYLIYAGISVLAATGSNVMNLTQLRKYIALKPVGNYNIKRHIQPVLIFFALSCATTIYTSLDSVMLGFMSTDADVGYYSAAVKIKNILVSFVVALGTVLLPRVSYYFQQDKQEEFWAIVKKALTFVVLAALPLSVYFMIFAKNGIYFLSGSGYNQAIAPMIVIMPTVLMIGLTNILGIQILVPMGREHIVMWSTIVGAIVDLILNVILIPSMQALGAAIGTLVAEFSVLLFQYFALYNEINPIIKTIRLPLIIFSVAISACASFWVGKIFTSHFLILAVSAIIFFSVYLLLLNLFKEATTLELQNQILGKLKKQIRKT